MKYNKHSEEYLRKKIMKLQLRLAEAKNGLVPYVKDSNAGVVAELLEAAGRHRRTALRLQKGLAEMSPFRQPFAYMKLRRQFEDFKKAARNTVELAHGCRAYGRGGAN